MGLATSQGGTLGADQPSRMRPCRWLRSCGSAGTFRSPRTASFPRPSVYRSSLPSSFRRRRATRARSHAHRSVRFAGVIASHAYMRRFACGARLRSSEGLRVGALRRRHWARCATHRFSTKSASETDGKTKRWSMTPEMPIIIRESSRRSTQMNSMTRFNSHCETSEAGERLAGDLGGSELAECVAGGGRVAPRGPFGRREIQPSRRTCACSTVSKAWDFPCIPTVYSYQDYNHLMLVYLLRRYLLFKFVPGSSSRFAPDCRRSLL